MQKNSEKKNRGTEAEQMERGEASFAELFDETTVREVRLEPGQKVEANVVRVSRDYIFVDLGDKTEGSLDRKELVDKDGNLTVREGDAIEVYFLSEKNNEKLFTTKMSGAAVQEHLGEIYRSGIPIEGFVSKEIKGGFEVNIAAGTRAFCPYSQMDLRRIEDSEAYIGKHLTFKISEFKEGGRNIIVSRRAFLEEEREKQKVALRETLHEGSNVKGVITSVRDFGAFIDIGGLEGLIPASEIGWGQVEDINEVVHAGQEVEAMVLKLDWENDRFAFSLKGTALDPWTTVPDKYQQGTIHTGRVSRIVHFGAFVTLEPGIDGLLHISQLGMGRKISHPREVIGKDQDVEVRIESVDMENRRIGLSLAHPEKHSDGAELSEGAERKRYEEFISRKESKGPPPMGTLGDLLKKKIEKS